VRVALKERGSHFLDLYEHEKGRAIKPIHIKGGPWIRSKASENNALFARLTRSILGHAPIGEYRQRFHPHLPTSCQCGAELQTRQHLVMDCPLYKEEWPGMVLTFQRYVKWLKKNPKVFAFVDDKKDPLLQARENFFKWRMTGGRITPDRELPERAHSVAHADRRFRDKWKAEREAFTPPRFLSLPL